MSFNILFLGTVSLGIIAFILYLMHVAKKGAWTDTLSRTNKRSNRFEEKLRTQKEAQREDLKKINNIDDVNRARGVRPNDEEPPYS